MWTAIAYAAPLDVPALIAQLSDPDAADRIAAANALTKTPPNQLAELERRGPCFDAPEAAGCELHNHALYHWIGVLEVLALRSVDPTSPYAATCDPSTRICPAVRALWRLGPEQLGLPTRDDPEAPKELSGDALVARHQAALARVLNGIPSSWTGAFTGAAGPWRVWLAPRCVSEGFYGYCRWVARSAGGAAPVTRAVGELGPPLWATEDERVEVRADGLAFYLWSGGMGEDPDRWGIEVLDLTTLAVRCSLFVEGGATWSDARKAEVLAAVSVGAQGCSAPAGVIVRSP